MFSVHEFFDEIDLVFGFYFDVGMACHIAGERIKQWQQEAGSTDDSLFMYGDGPPLGDPEHEIERALHASTVGAVKSRLADDSFDATKAAETAVVFTFHIWEEKYRQNLIDKAGKPIDGTNSDIMGDLRLLRNSIIHNKGIAKKDMSRCKIITRFKPGERIVLLNQDVYAIIRTIRAEFGKYA